MVVSQFPSCVLHASSYTNDVRWLSHSFRRGYSAPLVTQLLSGSCLTVAVLCSELTCAYDAFDSSLNVVVVVIFVKKSSRGEQD